MASALTATQLILNALRPNQTPAAWESDFDRAQASWDDLAVRAIVLGLAPQFDWRLAQWRMDVPPSAAAKLKAAYQASAERNRAIYAQLGEVLSACAERGLRPVALKGVHLAACVYPEPALRPMSDIDLLFMPGELPQAEAMLAALGYGGTHKPADVGPGVTKHTSTFRRPAGQAATPNPYLSTAAERTIEPHTSLEESWFGLKIDITPGVRDRAVEADLGGRVCRVLAGEDVLLHVCVHFCFHLIMGAPSMVQLADLLAITRAGNLDWPVFTRRAIDCHAAPFVLAALMLARNLIEAPVPVEVIERLSLATPGSLRTRINRLGLADILYRTQQKPLTTIGQRVRRGFSDRAETARWAPDLRGRWLVWKSALQIGKTDTWRAIRKA
ncbi:MAG TPA: nucleotidyltransferase family protein [Anaerolineae bacterium]|nr:nucleotidyltransferase family protein [Anaerolineae bacterium]